MINVHIKFYPPFTYYTKERLLEVELKEGSKLNELMENLIKMYPGLKDVIPDLDDENIFYNNVVPAINNNVVSFQQVINDNDTICLFACLSGG